MKTFKQVISSSTILEGKMKEKWQDEKSDRDDDDFESYRAEVEKKKKTPATSKTKKTSANESTNKNKHYDEASKHHSLASDAAFNGDKALYHAHMVDHHENMGQWHEAKGRSNSADAHFDRSNQHHEKFLKITHKLKEEVSSIDESKIEDKIRSHPAVEYYGGKDDDHMVNLKPGYWHRELEQRSFSNRNASMTHKELKHIEKIPKDQNDESVNEISTNTALNYATKVWDKGDDKRAAGLKLAIAKASGKAKVPTKEAVDEAKTGSEPGWMLKADPKLRAMLKAVQKRKKYIPAKSPTTKEEVEQVNEGAGYGIGSVVKLHKPIDGHEYGHVMGITGSKVTRGPTGRGTPMPAGKATSIQIQLKKTPNYTADYGAKVEVPLSAIHSKIREEVDQVDEVSSELLDRYKVGAKKSAAELSARGEHRKSTNRWGNIMRATGKQIDKTSSNIRKALGEEEVEEGIKREFDANKQLVNTPKTDTSKFPKQKDGENYFDYAYRKSSLKKKVNEIRMKKVAQLDELSPKVLSSYRHKSRHASNELMSKSAYGYHTPEQKAKLDRKAALRNRGLSRAATSHNKQIMAAAPKPVADKDNVPALKAELEKHKKSFDSHYQRSDDYSHFNKHKEIETKISNLQHRINKAAQIGD